VRRVRIGELAAADRDHVTDAVDDADAAESNATHSSRLVDAFSGLSAGFWLCERVRFPGGVEVVLTLCNA
jgi:hypothetical protein